MKLYIIHYREDDNSKTFECVTNNFDKWLEEHNSRRDFENNEKENEDDFEVEEISLRLYD